MNVLEKLFESNDFKKEQSGNASVDLYSKDDSQFFFVVRYDENQLKQYFDTKLTEDVFDIYSNLEKKQVSATKNSSLIILADCGDSVDNSEFINQVYKIEEDAYGMRKYVIVSRSEFFDTVGQMDEDQLRNLIDDKNKFGSYQEKGLAYKDYEYMLAVQIFIKLPFLSIGENKTGLKTISELIEEIMEADDNRHVMNLNKEEAIFKDKEGLFEKALSLSRNDFDDWLDRFERGSKS